MYIPDASWEVENLGKINIERHIDFIFEFKTIDNSYLQLISVIDNDHLVKKKVRQLCLYRPFSEST